MAETQIKIGQWVASSNQCAMEGVYETQGAAKLAYRLTPCELSELWQRIGFAENGNPDGTTDYALTHDDMTKALSLKRTTENGRAE